jgi:biopolymer transport protein ExbD
LSFFKENECEEKPEIIIVPMVDVMLFLIAFFVLIAGSLIPGIAMKTNPPETVQKSSVKVKRKVIGVTIKEDGTVYYGKQKMDFKTLVRLFKSFKKQDPTVSLVIDADRRAPVQSLVIVMDAAKKAGIDSLGLLAKEKHGNFK